MTIKLSKHFSERWCERVKTPVPTDTELAGMINDALLLQRYRDVYTPRGRAIRILALYWMVDDGVIVKIDERAGIAVTVIAQNMEDVDDNV